MEYSTVEKRKLFFKSVTEKPSMSVMVQKIQFRICLRGTYLPLLLSKGPSWCNSWCMTMLKQECLWIMHTCASHHTLQENLLTERGHKVIWGLLGSSIFSWVTLHPPTLWNYRLDVNYSYESTTWKINFYAVQTGR